MLNVEPQDYQKKRRAGWQSIDPAKAGCSLSM